MSKEYKPDTTRVHCRICGNEYLRSGMMAHANGKHKEIFRSWLEGRGGFGMSIWQHFGVGKIEPAAMRT